MRNIEKISREPLFHIVKRDIDTKWKAAAIRCGAVFAALIVCSLVVVILIRENPFTFFGAMFEGAFGTTRRIWILIHKAAILLCISLAVTPAFKMRFWNIGAEGQILMGALATIACMFYLKGDVPKPVLWILMCIAGIVGGAVWAVIPAIFKAKWNTNETLFTLMMNYVAIQLVSFCVNMWVKDGSGALKPMIDYGLPKLGNKWLLNIIIIAILTVAVYIYLRYSKHGYELSVVGESEKTANYIGVNVRRVILRTMLLSGAICGLAGLLIAGGQNQTISTATAGGQGFTAIMVSWLAKFNPLYMVLTSFLVVFLQVGANQVSTVFRINSSLSDIVTAIILFFIIGCEFFINYRIVFRSSGKEKTES